jgi:hypothetical protein
MANGTSTPVLAAVPRPTDIGSEIRNAYAARENLRALLLKVHAARVKVDTDLAATTIRDFGGPRPDGAETAVKRVDDANRERSRLDAQESAVGALEALITGYLDRIRRELPGAIIAELQRRRAELERQLASEQADVAAIEAQLALIDEELKKLEADGNSPAGRPAARTSKRKTASAGEGSSAAATTAPAEAAVAESPVSSAGLSATAPGEPARSRTAHRGARNGHARRR